MLSPSPLYHPSFYPVIFLSVVSPHSAWPPVLSYHLPHEDALHRRRPLIVAANEVHYQPRESIDTAVNVKTPRLEFLVSIMVK